MGTDFDAVSLRSATSALEADANDLDKPARIGRRALYHAMTASGFSNYPAEWWHYDYGNAFWRYFNHVCPGPVFRTVL
jgi:D-alanyl-D-alanine dipeptidase